MSDENTEITVDEVNKVLSEIENKYSPVKCASLDDGFEENLTVLSKEFDSVGVDSIDLNKPFSKIFKQVVSSARSLIQIHRRTLSLLKDVNVTVQSKNSKSNYLYKCVDDYNSKINSYKIKTGQLENKISVLESQISEQKRKEATMKHEMDEVKRHFNGKINDNLRHITKLYEENRRLRESLGTDLKTTHTKDEVILKVMSKYKQNEEIYKKTIHKLQENNRQLIEELVHSKSDEKRSELK